jgi:hypothetical protein
MKMLRWLRFKIAWWRWFFSEPFRLGDPALGKGAERDRNRKLLWARHDAKEPKPEQYGLQVRS